MRLIGIFILILFLCFQTACTQTESFHNRSNGQGFAGRIEDPSSSEKKIANYSNSDFVCKTERIRADKLVLSCQIYVKDASNGTSAQATEVEAGVQFTWQIFAAALSDISSISNCSVSNSTLSYSCELKNENQSLVEQINIVLSISDTKNESSYVISKPLVLPELATLPETKNLTTDNSSSDEIPVEEVPAQISWTGAGGNSNWTTALNWAGGVVPGANDTAYFANACNTNCNVTINSNINVKGIYLSSSYTGTLTQALSKSISVGAFGWTQYGGVFSGGDSNITLSGVMTLSGGTFTSTSAKLIFPGGADSITFFVLAPNGSFIHNLGTFEVSVGAITGRIYTASLSKPLNLFHLTINYRTDYGSATLIASGDVVNVKGNLTQIAGYIIGAYNLFGNLILGSSANSGGTGNINFVGNGVQTYSSEGGRCAGITINNSNGVVPAPGTTDLYIFGGKFYLNNGSFTAPFGTLTIDVASMPSGDIFTVKSGANYIHNFGGLTFAGGRGAGYFENNYTFNLAQPLELFHLTSKFRPDYASGSISVPSTQTVNVNGIFTQDTGYFGGNYNVYGDVNQMNAPYFNGTYSLTFKGPASQVWTRQTANQGGTGNVTINKSGGSVVLASNINLSASGQSLAVSSGTLDLNGMSLIINNTLNIASPSVLTINGGSHTQNTFINNGTVN